MDRTQNKRSVPHNTTWLSDTMETCIREASGWDLVPPYQGIHLPLHKYILVLVPRFVGVQDFASFFHRHIVSLLKQTLFVKRFILINFVIPAWFNLSQGFIILPGFDQVNLKIFRFNHFRCLFGKDKTLYMHLYR